MSNKPEIPAAPGRPVVYLLERELAKRWRLSERTLQRWRCLEKGPAFHRIEKRVVYLLNDVESYEAASRVAGGPAS